MLKGQLLKEIISTLHAKKGMIWISFHSKINVLLIKLNAGSFLDWIYRLK